MLIDRKTILLRCHFFPNSSISHLKLPTGCYMDLSKLILRFISKDKRPEYHTALKNNKFGGMTIPITI